MRIELKKAGRTRANLTNSGGGILWYKKRSARLSRKSRLVSLTNLLQLANFFLVELSVLDEFGNRLRMRPGWRLIER